MSRFELIVIVNCDPFEEETVQLSDNFDTLAIALKQRGEGRIVDTAERLNWTPSGGWTPIHNRLGKSTTRIARGARRG